MIGVSKNTCHVFLIFADLEWPLRLRLTQRLTSPDATSIFLVWGQKSHRRLAAINAKKEGQFLLSFKHVLRLAKSRCIVSIGAKPAALSFGIKALYWKTNGQDFHFQAAQWPPCPQTIMSHSNGWTKRGSWQLFHKSLQPNKTTVCYWRRATDWERLNGV